MDDLRQYVSERVESLFQIFSKRCPPDDTGMGGVRSVDMDYVLAYDAEGQRLHFGADDLLRLTFMVNVYDSAGHLVLQFPASQGASVVSLPPGMYVVTWKDSGHHAVKLMLKSK